MFLLRRRKRLGWHLYWPVSLASVHVKVNIEAKRDESEAWAWEEKWPKSVSKNRKERTHWQMKIGRRQVNALIGTGAFVSFIRTRWKYHSSEYLLELLIIKLSGQSQISHLKKIRLSVPSFSLSYLPNPSARAGYDTRSVFKRSLTGLNSEFSFS